MGLVLSFSKASCAALAMLSASTLAYDVMAVGRDCGVMVAATSAALANAGMVDFLMVVWKSCLMALEIAVVVCSTSSKMCCISSEVRPLLLNSEMVLSVSLR